MSERSIIGRILFGPRSEELRRPMPAKPYIPLERAILCGCGIVYQLNGGHCPICGMSTDYAVPLRTALKGKGK